MHVAQARCAPFLKPCLSGRLGQQQALQLMRDQQ
jgi:hypothetical protein